MLLDPAHTMSEMGSDEYNKLLCINKERPVEFDTEIDEQDVKIRVGIKVRDEVDPKELAVILAGFKKNFGDKSLVSAIENIMDRDVLGKLESDTIDVSLDGAGNFSFSTDNGLTPNEDAEAGKYEMHFTKGSVHADIFVVPDKYQGRGTMKDMLLNLHDVCTQIDVNDWNLVAAYTGGGHAWGRAGFKVVQEAAKGYKGAAVMIKQNAFKYKDLIFKTISPGKIKEMQIAIDLLGQGGPVNDQGIGEAFRALWHINDFADRIAMPNGDITSLGAILGRGAVYNATFNLKDPDSMNRFRNYASKEIKDSQGRKCNA